MIKKQTFLATLIFFFLIHLTPGSNAQERRFSFSREKMGSPFDIILYDVDSLHAVKLADEAFLLVDSLVNIFSDYIDSSELNKLSSFSGDNNYVIPTPALYDILLQSERAYKLSNGAFDITIGPLVKLWRKARKEKQFPDALSVLKAKQLVGFYKLKIYPASKSIKLMQPGMQLDLGGIAQGYIAQKVLDRLQQHSVKRVLVDVSGDITMGDQPPGTKGWTIGINMPQRTEELQKQKLLLRNCSVSTSGDVYQYIEHNGKRYSHIIDPLTGYGITSQRNVTVIAKEATTADWLATACSILTVSKAKRLAKKMNAELMIAEIQNGVVILHSSNHFKEYFK
ncbi:MAG TPA: FAD:protein FMN transferase [Chitinophagaceae bacterium]|nr:FAD:protein FMN transferase [Chitinophagaceae bacterium]